LRLPRGDAASPSAEKSSSAMPMPMSMRAIPDRYPNVDIAKRCRPSTSTRTVFLRVLDNDNADESSPDGSDISLAVRGGRRCGRVRNG
jgi:hypothetical protein